jgi:undecaprenyl-diphosphatase
LSFCWLGAEDRLRGVQWLRALDIELFRFVNEKLANPFFDVVMPFASGNVFFAPLLVATGILLVWKGRVRGFVCVLMLAGVLPVGDGLIFRTIKHAVARPRPFLTLNDVRRPGGKNDPMARPPPTTAQPNGRPAAGSGSMPSAHAANWFAATMIAFIYYRRSLRFMLPMAALVGFSRIYNGVHYPSDVLAGAILGAGYAAAAVWSLDALWRWAGRNWFPVWWARLPSLLDPTLQTTHGSREATRVAESARRELR